MKGMIEGFFGFEIFDFVFFGGKENVGKYFFFRLFHAFWKYLMARKVGTWGYILVKGFFGVLFKVLAIFFGGGRGVIFPPFDHPCHLNPGVPPWAGAL